MILGRLAGEQKGEDHVYRSTIELWVQIAAYYILCIPDKIRMSTRRRLAVVQPVHII